LQTRIIVTAVILAVALVVLLFPWYPVVTSQVLARTFTYSYSYQVPTLSYASEGIYTLSNPITLQGFFQSGAQLSEVYQDLGDVNLQNGWVIHVQVVQCQNCYTDLSKDFGSKETVYSLGGSGEGNIIIADSGQYKIGVDNLGTTRDQVTSISITADVPRSDFNTISNVGHNTVTVAQHSVTTLAAYLVLGMVPSLIVLVVIIVLLGMAVLFDLGLIQVSRRRRRRR
jgi:hypothetical protein